MGYNGKYNLGPFLRPLDAGVVESHCGQWFTQKIKRKRKRRKNYYPRKNYYLCPKGLLVCLADPVSAYAFHSKKRNEDRSSQSRLGSS